MALYPEAVKKLLPENRTQSRIRPRAVIWHSDGGGKELYGWWMNPASKGVESHFWIDWDGTVYQYMDTEVRADANGDANGFAVSVETASSRTAAEPWTKYQVAALVRLTDWLCKVHPAIERRQMRFARDSGIAWHVQFGAPGPWTSARGKVCPGPARIRQVPAMVTAIAARRTLNPPVDDDWLSMASKQEVQEIVAHEANRVIGEVWKARAAADKGRKTVLDRLGQAIGWTKGHAVKDGVTRDEAVKYDPYSSEK